jgi:hypothetical protein
LPGTISGSCSALLEPNLDKIHTRVKHGEDPTLLGPARDYR